VIRRRVLANSMNRELFSVAIRSGWNKYQRRVVGGFEIWAGSSGIIWNKPGRRPYGAMTDDNFTDTDFRDGKAAYSLGLFGWGQSVECAASGAFQAPGERTQTTALRGRLSCCSAPRQTKMKI